MQITPLRLDAFEQLPKHARRCVFWEVDPATLTDDEPLADPEFEKEAWLSMVMLEWGSCGQVATGPPAQTGIEVLLEPSCLGYALYAPPRAVPRTHRFPTAPVSADAVLLTSMNVEPGNNPEAVRDGLIGQVVDELIRRGVRALEAFGRTRAVAEIETPVTAENDLHAINPVLVSSGDCSIEHCVIEDEVLLAAGFTVVAPHRYFPRLRLELDRGLSWKGAVESALELLLQEAQANQPVATGAVTTTR